MKPVFAPESAEGVAIELPLEPESARDARDSLDRLEADMEAASLDEVRLLVSELVADALASDELPPDGTISLRAEAMDGRARVYVGFDGLVLNLRARKPELGHPGWGIYLIRSLSRRWATRHDLVGTYVWFEL